MIISLSPISIGAIVILAVTIPWALHIDAIRRGRTVKGTFN